jgi:hypothetical protein
MSPENVGAIHAQATAGLATSNVGGPLTFIAGLLIPRIISLITNRINSTPTPSVTPIDPTANPIGGFERIVDEVIDAETTRVDALLLDHLPVIGQALVHVNDTVLAPGLKAAFHTAMTGGWTTLVPLIAPVVTPTATA